MKLTIRSSLLASTLATTCLLGFPHQLNAQELRIIADTQSILAANPDGTPPHSLFIGLGTGLYPQVNEAGQVVFGVQSANANPAEDGRVQLYRHQAGAGLQYLLGDEDLLSDPNGESVRTSIEGGVASGFKPTITGEGTALMMCSLSGSNIDSGNNRGLVRAQPDGASPLLAQHQSPLGELQVSSVIGAVEPEGLVGQQYIAVQLNSSGTDTAILHRSASETLEVIRTNMEAPGVPGAHIAALPYPLRTLRNANDRGDIAFGATMTGKGVDSSNNGGVWRLRNGELSLVARDGDTAQGDASGCQMYGSAYSRLMLNGEGSIAFHAGTMCGDISVFSDRSGELRREASADMLYDGPTGRFRLAFVGEVATALGTIGDSVTYLRGFLADSGDLFVMGPILHEDRSIRSSWGIVRITPDRLAEVILESSSQFSALGLPLGAAPFPEQLSFSRDGSLLARVQEQGSTARVLIAWAPERGLSLVRDADIIDEHVVRVGGGNHASGVAMLDGRAFADVRVFGAGDDPNSAGRAAILALGAGGQKSLPVIAGRTVVRNASELAHEVTHFASPFASTTKRNVASESGALVLIGDVQRDGLPPQQAVLLMPSQLPGVDPADFDQNGVVNVADIFAFLAAWFAVQPRADINLNGMIEVSDIFAFLTLWFGGR